MIRGTCPDCGGIRPLPDYLADAEARAALAAALDCQAGLAKRIIPYLTLHSPPARAMAGGKLARLLRELADLLGSGQVSRRGISHAAPQAVWEAAFDALEQTRAAGTLTLPLEGHGYLTAIAWDKAAKATAGVGSATATAATAPTVSHPSHRPADVPPRPTTPGTAGPVAVGALLKQMKGGRHERD